MQMQEKERIAQEFREKEVNEHFMYEEAMNELYELQNKKIGEIKQIILGQEKKEMQMVLEKQRV